MSRANVILCGPSDTDGSPSNLHRKKPQSLFYWLGFCHVKMHQHHGQGMNMEWMHWCDASQSVWEEISRRLVGGLLRTVGAEP